MKTAMALQYGQTMRALLVRISPMQIALCSSFHTSDTASAFLSISGTAKLQRAQAAVLLRRMVVARTTA